MSGIDAGDTPRQFLEERAREMLEHSTDSVSSELDHAQGWLQESGFGQPGSYWQVEGLAGGLGALANAWGRLTLWTRGNGTYASVQGELDRVMEQLVELWGRLLHEAPAAGDLDTLRDILERMRALRDRTARGDAD